MLHWVWLRLECCCLPWRTVWMQVLVYFERRGKTVWVLYFVTNLACRVLLLRQFDQGQATFLLFVYPLISCYTILFWFSLFFLCPFLKGIWFGENICIFVYTIFAIYKHRYFVREKKINQILYLYLKAKIVVCEWFMDIWMVKHISSQANLSLIHAYERCANASWTWKKNTKERLQTNRNRLQFAICHLLPQSCERPDEQLFGCDSNQRRQGAGWRQ